MAKISQAEQDFNLNTLRQEYRQILADMKAKLQEGFKGFFRKFFNDCPEVKAVVWTQYSPYFNDGEECVFGVNDATFTNATGEDLYDVRWGEYDGENPDVWAAEAWRLEKFPEPVRHRYELCREINSIITSGDMSDILESMFGNHVRVIATKEGFDVEEYEHD